VGFSAIVTVAFFGYFVVIAVVAVVAGHSWGRTGSSSWCVWGSRY